MRLLEVYSRAPATLKRALLGHGERCERKLVRKGKQHEMGGKVKIVLKTCSGLYIDLLPSLLI